MIRDTASMDRELEPPRRRARWIAAAVAGAAFLGALAVLVPTVLRWSEAERTVERSRLRTAVVSRGDLVHQIAVEGRVVAASRPTLFSPSPGIVALHVREGQRAAAGDVLAVVESPELGNRLQQEGATLAALESDLGRRELEARRRDLENRQEVELAEVRSAAAGRALERAERLSGLGLLNDIDLEAARDELTVRTLELEQARQQQAIDADVLAFEVEDARLRVARQHLVLADLERQVEELTVRAPFDGLVSTVAIDDRDAVVRGQALVGVVDLSDLEVEVAIPETYADDVSPGMEAVIVVGRDTVAGTVTRVAPEVQGSLVAGRVTFDHGVPPGLRQNQRVSTRLVLAHREDVLKLPRGPFLEAGGGRSAFVVDGDMARRRAIRVGAVSVEEIEVVEGLEAGEEVILSDLGIDDGATTLLLRD